MLQKLLQRVGHLGHVSGFEGYLTSLHDGRRTGVPTHREARRDFQAAARYKMIAR